MAAATPSTRPWPRPWPALALAAPALADECARCVATACSASCAPSARAVQRPASFAPPARWCARCECRHFNCERLRTPPTFKKGSGGLGDRGVSAGRGLKNAERAARGGGRSREGSACGSRRRARARSIATRPPCPPSPPSPPSPSPHSPALSPPTHIGRTHRPLLTRTRSRGTGSRRCPLARALTSRVQNSALPAERGDESPIRLEQRRPALRGVRVVRGGHARHELRPAAHLRLRG
jgi:hypothetical protein